MSRNRRSRVEFMGGGPNCTISGLLFDSKLSLLASDCAPVVMCLEHRRRPWRTENVDGAG